MRSSASWPLRSVTISSGASGISGRARSRTSPVCLTASAARARPGPIAAAASAPVAPSGSSSGVPSGRVTFIGSDATRAPAADARPRESRHSSSALLMQTRAAPEQEPPVACAAVDDTALRSHFPVLAERAYLNAGTCGPLARETLQAATSVLERAAAEGRTRAYMETMVDLRARQRRAYAD